MVFRSLVWRLAFLCGLALFGAGARSLELTGAVVTHDPSAIVQDGDTYFSFSTGQGIGVKTSTDLVAWSTAPAPVFGQVPAWVYRKIPGFDGGFWAPDVIQMNGAYYLYYSVSTFGSSTSAIGVARTASLQSPAWEDLGVVVESFGGIDEINAIDPALFRDQDGRVYFTYGSFFGGIGIAEVDQGTGKLLTNVRRIFGGGFADVEASYLTRIGPYYLFVNRGACCQGANSSYSIQVLRSTSVFGPYAEPRTILPTTDGKYRGPGHLGVMKQNACNVASTHYYDLTDNGTPKLDILQLKYADGWPQLDRNVDLSACELPAPVADGVYRLVNKNSRQVIDVSFCSTENGKGVQQWGWLGSECQRWNITGDGGGSFVITGQHSGLALDGCGTQASNGVIQQAFNGSSCQKWRLEPLGGGDFRVVNVSRNLVLSVQGASRSAGAPLNQTAWTGRNSQIWRLQPVSRNTAPTGSFVFTPAHSGQALDLQDCRLEPNANVWQWPRNNLPCQTWTVSPTPDGYFQIASIHSGLLLQVEGGSTANGANVNQAMPRADGRQRWEFEAVGNGYYRITNKRSGRVLDVSQCSVAPGANVQQWEWLATGCQRWRLEPVSAF